MSGLGGGGISTSAGDVKLTSLRGGGGVLLTEEVTGDILVDLTAAEDRALAAFARSRAASLASDSRREDSGREVGAAAVTPGDTGGGPGVSLEISSFIAGGGDM